MWTEQLDRAFQLSKETIVKKITSGVELFDTNLPTCLATDFSATGIGFFLLQKTYTCQSKVPTCCVNGWRLCLVGSRFLHNAETRYSSIKGKALAVAYALHQCRYFILGCKDLTVPIDHKPLLNILNQSTGVTLGTGGYKTLRRGPSHSLISLHHRPCPWQEAAWGRCCHQVPSWRPRKINPPR